MLIVYYNSEEAVEPVATGAQDISEDSPLLMCSSINAVPSPRLQCPTLEIYNFSF
jgi:hypothetical protein